MRFITTCACDKIIVDKHGAHSLIAVMSNADIAITALPNASNQLPANAMLPREWWVFSMWEPSSDEVNKEFEQIIEVYWPNGDKLLDGKLKFKTDERISYNSYQVLGFPVGQSGKIKIITWVENKGTRITEPFVYYITIRHIPEGQNAQAPPASR